MQTKHDIQQLKPTDFSQVTFWDTDLTRIDWELNADFVMERVFFIGTPEEQNRIVAFYGIERLSQFANTFKSNPYNSSVLKNINEVLDRAALWDYNPVSA